MNRTTILSALVGATLIAMCPAALAGGNHAGGHGHQDDSPVGVPGTAAKVARTIMIEASDTMRFEPSDILVKQGETLRFVVKNVGRVMHEFSLGTEKELKEHYEVMKKFPDMVHDEPNKVSLKPGEQGEVIWHFTKAGTVHFACLHPGHYDAGMKGQIQVAKK